MHILCVESLLKYCYHDIYPTIYKYIDGVFIDKVLYNEKDSLVNMMDQDITNEVQMKTQEIFDKSENELLIKLDFEKRKNAIISEMAENIIFE